VSRSSTVGGTRRRLRAFRNVVRCATYDLRRKRPRSPLMVYVELTRRCNLRCRHCDIWKTQREHRDILEKEVPAAVLLSNLGEMSGKGLLAVDLFGGEPLLRNDLGVIVEGLRSYGLHVTITTNGTLLSSDAGLRLPAAGLNQLLVSLDASGPELHDRLRGSKGAFGAATAGIAAFLAAAGGSVRVGVNTLVCRENIEELPVMPAFVRSLGASHLRLLPYHQCYPFITYGADDRLTVRREDVGRLAVALEALKAAARAEGISTNSPSYLNGILSWFEGAPDRVRCMAGLGVCDINAFGDVYPCYTLGQPVGNIQQRRFAEIWESPEMETHRRGTRHCRGCWQSCYIEPGLRLSPSALVTDWRTLLHDMIEYS